MIWWDVHTVIVCNVADTLVGGENISYFMVASFCKHWAVLIWNLRGGICGQARLVHVSFTLYLLWKQHQHNPWEALYNVSCQVLYENIITNHWLCDCLFISWFRLKMQKAPKICITGPLWGESTSDCITGPLWGESTSGWWIPPTKGQ